MPGSTSCNNDWQNCACAPSVDAGTGCLVCSCGKSAYKIRFWCIMGVGGGGKRRGWLRNLLNQGEPVFSTVQT